ncbi:hypothetical protein ACOTFH_29665 [Achromobacter xylosoxidans]
MHNPDFLWFVSSRRFSTAEVARVFDVPLHWFERPANSLHDPEDTTTPAAPGAIQIGPLDVS